jgi:hypothetical protein
MIALKALPARDYYTCLDCSALVEYPRTHEPEGIVERLCDGCFEVMLEHSTAILAESARTARVYLDEHPPTHLQTDDAPDRVWLELTDDPDLSAHLEDR